MKKQTYVTIGFIVLVLALVVYLMYFSRPAYPVEWNGAEPGMSRAEILKLFPHIGTAMKEIKGFDSCMVENRRPYHRDGYWLMIITYDGNDNVETVSYSYVDRKCGLLSKGIGKSKKH